MAIFSFFQARNNLPNLFDLCFLRWLGRNSLDFCVATHLLCLYLYVLIVIFSRDSLVGWALCLPGSLFTSSFYLDASSSKCRPLIATFPFQLPFEHLLPKFDFYWASRSFQATKIPLSRPQVSFSRYLEMNIPPTVVDFTFLIKLSFCIICSTNFITFKTI